MSASSQNYYEKLKNKVNQQHIPDCADRNAEQRILFPQMNQGCGSACDELRKYDACVAVCKILKTVDNEYADYGNRQNVTKVFYKFGHFFCLQKQRKGTDGLQRCRRLQQE